MVISQDGIHIDFNYNRKNFENNVIFNILSFWRSIKIYLFFRFL